MKTHSSILAWRIPWTEEPARLQSLGSKYLDITELLELGRESLIHTHTHTHHHHHLTLLSPGVC